MKVTSLTVIFVIGHLTIRLHEKLRAAIVYLASKPKLKTCVPSTGITDGLSYCLTTTSHLTDWLHKWTLPPYVARWLRLSWHILWRTHEAKQLAHFTTPCAHGLYSNWNKHGLCECGAATIMVTSLPGYKNVDHSGGSAYDVWVSNFLFQYLFYSSTDIDDCLSFSVSFLALEGNSRAVGTRFKDGKYAIARLHVLELSGEWSTLALYGNKETI